MPAFPPVSLRLSVTDLCQLRCIYCMPECGVQKVRHEDVLSFEEMAHFVRIVKDLRGLSKVHLTGGEPLVRSGVVELVKMLAEEGISDLALTTNGQRLAEMAGDLRAAGLRRVNVSLETLSAEKFRRLTRGGDLSQTLAGIDAARQHGLAPVKLNVVVLRGTNEKDIEALIRFGLEREIEVRFLELMPIGPAARHYEEWFVAEAEIRAIAARSYKLVPRGRSSGASSVRYSVEGNRQVGTIGFISPQSHPFCGDCQRLRLTATGRLLGCLAREEGVDVRGMLRSQAVGEGEWREALNAALQLKRHGRRFQDQRPMIGIGG